MKRSGPLQRRAPLRNRPARAVRERPAKSQPVAMREPPLASLAAADGAVRARPKEPHDENPALLELARGRPCLFLFTRGCRGDEGSTTVACHENRLSASKGAGYKAHDWRSAWGCSCCHKAFDEGALPADVEDAIFDAAWVRQLHAWRAIADNPVEKPKARAAASWALAHAAAWLEAHGRTDLLRVARGAG